jgi:hypothetical protein
MLIIQCPDINITRLKSAAPIAGTSDVWIVTDESEFTHLRALASVEILDIEDIKRIITVRDDLPPTNPIYGQRTLRGPIPSGALPGDIRINNDGTQDCFDEKTNTWREWRNQTGESISIEP